MAKYETLNVTTKAKATISKLAEKHEKSLVQFVDEMANYFAKTGVNPNDMVILSPAEELKKFRDTIVSFLRKQEKDFILPVFSRIDTVAMLLLNQYSENQNAIPGGAPKIELKTKPSLATSDSEVSLKNEEQSTQAMNLSQDVVAIEEYKKLKSQHDILELKYKTVLEYFQKVITHTENKSTGLNKAPVINLPLAEINGYRDYLKRQ